jgi:hypothetical protein
LIRDGFAFSGVFPKPTHGEIAMALLLRRSAAWLHASRPAPARAELTVTEDDARSELIEQVTTALAVVVAVAIVLSIAVLLGAT